MHCCAVNRRATVVPTELQGVSKGDLLEFRFTFTTLEKDKFK